MAKTSKVLQAGQATTTMKKKRKAIRRKTCDAKSWCITPKDKCDLTGEESLDANVVGTKKRTTSSVNERVKKWRAKQSGLKPEEQTDGYKRNKGRT